MNAIFQSGIGSGYSRQMMLCGTPADIAGKIRDYAASEPAGSLIAVHTDSTVFVANRDENGWHFKTRSPVGRACARLLA